MCMEFSRRRREERKVQREEILEKVLRERKRKIWIAIEAMRKGEEGFR